MPIDTHIAGSPQSLSSLAGQLEGGFAAACDDLESSIIQYRRTAEDHWKGRAGEAAVGDINDTRQCAEKLRAAAKGIGAAIETFSSALKSAQNMMEDARDIARSGGLVVTERLIEGPPPAPDPSWETPGMVTLQPAQEEPFREWSEKMAVWNQAVETADGAVDTLATACRTLVDDLGDQSEVLAAIGDLLEPMVPGAIGLPGERVLPGVEDRMRRAATNAGFLASISPEQSKALYENLFMQMDRLDDADSIRRLSDLSKYGGSTVDALMVSMNAIERHEMGQSNNQILLAEGAGIGAGVMGTAFAWGGYGVAFGAPATPVGSLIVGGLALTAGVGAGFYASSYVDDWYEDKEFEELIRNARPSDAQP